MPKNCDLVAIKNFNKYLDICSRCLNENDENSFMFCNNNYNLSFCDFSNKTLKLQGESGSIMIRQCNYCKIFTILNGSGLYICPGIPLQVSQCNLCNNKNEKIICAHMAKFSILKQETNCVLEYKELTNNYKCKNCFIQMPLKKIFIWKKSYQV